MIKVNDQKPIPTGEGLTVESSDQKDDTEFFPESFFADTSSVQDKIFQGNPMNGLKSLAFPTNQIKARLRKSIAKNLIESLKVPELVDGLVEFLFEIVKEDPAQARLLGIYE